MPRRTSAEIIADLEAKLAEAKAKDESKTQAEKDKEKLARTSKIEKLDERIVKGEQRISDDQAYVAKLKAERDALVAEADEAEQPTLPVESSVKA